MHERQAAVREVQDAVWFSVEEMVEPETLRFTAEGLPSSDVVGSQDGVQFWRQQMNV